MTEAAEGRAGVSLVANVDSGRRMQSRAATDQARRLRWHLQRLPPGDGSGTVPRLIVVGDAWEQSAQFDGGRELAALSVGSTDRGGVCFGDDEHPVSMGRRIEGGKRYCDRNRRGQF
jgi:hypothetical protein